MTLFSSLVFFIIVSYLNIFPHLKPFTGHEDKITCLTIPKTNDFIYSGSLDNTLRSWDIETGEMIQTFEGHILLCLISFF